MNIIDRAISIPFPGWAARRAEARYKLGVYSSYEAAKPSRHRKRRGDAKSGSATANEAVKTLREIARDLEQNHDIAKGGLDILVNCTVGNGIIVEPMVKDTSGKLLDDVNEQIADLRNEWARTPDVTKELSNGEMERLVARSLFRDGEVFAQHVEGNVIKFRHGSNVPYSIELIESDMVPELMIDMRKRITSGIERNGWGEPIGYHVLKTHPGDAFNFNILFDTKRVPAERISHLKMTTRIKQNRGISIFASAYTRLDDLRDFEESERIAARIAAAQVMAITRSPDVPYDSSTVGEDRLFDVAPGTVWEDLLPGEKPEILSSDRPNNNLADFRMGQLKAAAAGMGVNYSSLAKNYAGTYSSQRQELAESYGTYGANTFLFIQWFTRPNYDRFLRMALLKDLIDLPPNVDVNTLYHAEFVGPVAPWIDPYKEIKADETAINLKTLSRSQAIRKRGGSPRDTFKQIELENKLFDNQPNNQNTNGMNNQDKGNTGGNA